jgi:hypothetical protein
VDSNANFSILTQNTNDSVMTFPNTTQCDLTTPQTIRRIQFSHAQASPMGRWVSFRLQLLFGINDAVPVYEEAIPAPTGFKIVDFDVDVPYRALSWDPTNTSMDETVPVTRWVPKEEDSVLYFQSNAGVRYVTSDRGMRVDQLVLSLHLTDPTYQSIIHRPIFLTIRIPSMTAPLITFFNDNGKHAFVGYTSDGQFMHRVAVGDTVAPWSTPTLGSPVASNRTVTIGLQYSVVNNGQNVRLTFVDPTGQIFRADLPVADILPMMRTMKNIQIGSAPDRWFAPDPQQRLLVHEIRMYGGRTGNTLAFPDADMLRIHADMVDRWRDPVAPLVAYNPGFPYVLASSV